jgi:hypothetical protein
MKVLKLLDKLNEEQKCLLGFSTALAILLALVMFLVTPVLEEAVLAKEEALGNEQKLLTYERYARQKELEKLEHALVQKLQALEVRLPRKISYEQIMNELYVLADEHAIKLLSLKQLSKAKGKEQRFYVHLKGEYKNALQFLSLLENEGSLKVLQDLVVKGDERGESLELTAILTAYNS